MVGYQLDYEPNLYIGNGRKSPCPSILNWLALGFQVGDKNLVTTLFVQCFFLFFSVAISMILFQNVPRLVKSEAKKWVSHDIFAQRFSTTTRHYNNHFFFRWFMQETLYRQVLFFVLGVAFKVWLMKYARHHPEKRWSPSDLLFSRLQKNSNQRTEKIVPESERYCMGAPITVYLLHLIWAKYNDLSRRLVTLNGGLVKESPKNPLNSGLGIILY